MIDEDCSPVIINCCLGSRHHVDICIIASSSRHNTEDRTLENFGLVLGQDPVKRNNSSVSSFDELSVIPKPPFMDHPIDSFGEQGKDEGHGMAAEVKPVRFELLILTALLTS